MRSASCAFPAECLWQTCWIGRDSCFWTVNCPQNDKECDDMIHNSDFHVNDDPITCKPCFNTACPGCKDAWENGCHNGAEMGKKVPVCENGDVTEGWDCGKEEKRFSSTVNHQYNILSGRKRCEWPTNERFADAEFDCPQVLPYISYFPQTLFPGQH